MAHKSPLSLLSLPAEIRLRIYHHIFLDTEAYANVPSFEMSNNIVSRVNPARCLKQKPSLRRLLSLLFACRTCHQEAEPVLYSLLQFNFQARRIELARCHRAVSTKHMLNRVETMTVRRSDIDVLLDDHPMDLHFGFPKL